jgi:hypothetical protein
LAAWRVEHGESWLLEVDPDTGYGTFLYSGIAEPQSTPQVEADYVAEARYFIEESVLLHGIDPDTLVFDRSVYLPLSLIESSDKTTVRFQQVVDGVPVQGGVVNVLLDTDEGHLLSLQGTAVPELSSMDTTPVIREVGAIALAAIQLFEDIGVTTDSATVNLVIALIEDVLGNDTPTLVWFVLQSGPEERGGVLAYYYLFDAKTGQLLRSQDAVKYYDVSGRITAHTTGGTRGLHSGSPVVQRPMSRIFVKWDDRNGQEGIEVTDQNGEFTIPGVDPPVDLTIKFEGEKTALVQNLAGGLGPVRSVGRTDGLRESAQHPGLRLQRRCGRNAASGHGYQRVQLLGHQWLHRRLHGGGRSVREHGLLHDSRPRTRPQPQFFGVDRLAETASGALGGASQSIVEHVFETVDRFGSSRPWEDDATLLVVRRLP